MSTIRLQKQSWNILNCSELSPANLLRLFQFSLVAGHLAKIRGEVKQTKIISQLSQNQLETTKLTLIENTSLEIDMRNECACLSRRKILGHLQTPPTPGHYLRCREGAPSFSHNPNLNQVSRVKSFYLVPQLPPYYIISWYTNQLKLVVTPSELQILHTLIIFSF